MTTTTTFNLDTAAEQLANFATESGLTLGTIRKIAKGNMAAYTLKDIDGNKLTISAKEDGLFATVHEEKETTSFKALAKQFAKEAAKAGAELTEELTAYKGRARSAGNGNGGQRKQAKATEQFTKWIEAYAETTSTIAGNEVEDWYGKKLILRKERADKTQALVNEKGELQRHIARIWKTKRNMQFKRALRNLRKLNEETLKHVQELYNGTALEHTVNFMASRLRG